MARLGEASITELKTFGKPAQECIDVVAACGFLLRQDVLSTDWEWLGKGYDNGDVDGIHNIRWTWRCWGWSGENYYIVLNSHIMDPGEAKAWLEGMPTDDEVTSTVLSLRGPICS